MKYLSIITEAEEKKDEISKFFERLKKRKPKGLDEQFQKAHIAAFKEIDCLSCANCCKTTSPIFRDVDIKRIAKKMRFTESQFERNYLQVDEDGDWVLKSAPCTFLNEDNSCSIYEYRPQACKDYPHTDRKKVVQVLDLTLKNIEICPAVAKISTVVLENSK